MRAPAVGAAAVNAAHTAAAPRLARYTRRNPLRSASLPATGPNTAKARIGPVVTQLMVLSSEPRSAAMAGTEMARMVMVLPTAKRPKSTVASTIQGYRSEASSRSATRRRNSSGHGRVVASSMPGASFARSVGVVGGSRRPSVP